MNAVTSPPPIQPRPYKPSSHMSERPRIQNRRAPTATCRPTQSTLSRRRNTQVFIPRQRTRRSEEEIERDMGRRIGDAEAELNLPPGFRFHPTDEELLVHYLCRRASHQLLPVPIIAELDLYKYNPWDLPDRALFGTREWYFFTPRDRKYPNGSRPNRAAGRGYWKATGADKPVTPAGSSRPIGIKKALVFYDGKPPKGAKTDWIMHEYRLADANRSARRNGSLRLDDWVLCRLYNKKKGWERIPKEETDLTEDSFRTPESDIELPDLDDLMHEGVDMNRSSGAAQLPPAAPAIKEEYDWYSDLNLEDLQNSFGPF